MSWYPPMHSRQGIPLPILPSSVWAQHKQRYRSVRSPCGHWVGSALPYTRTSPPAWKRRVAKTKPAVILKESTSRIQKMYTESNCNRVSHGSVVPNGRPTKAVNPSCTLLSSW